ncbi:hypothetical protein [Bacillus sp. V2I10]|nr:hypothetical protein [Bacillus sp. V2I10]MDQ0862280.1 hypothetical protein [Bacillus sp. V2I10]
MKTSKITAFQYRFNTFLVASVIVCSLIFTKREALVQYALVALEAL